MVIPKGKKIRITRIQDMKTTNRNSIIQSPIAGLPELLIEEDITLNITSNFEPIVSGDTKIGALFFSQIAGSVGINVGSNFKELGFQVWKGTQPLKFSATVGLYMKTDAKVDVFDPMKTLTKIILPEDLSQRTTGNRGFGLKAPGPTILENFGVSNDAKRALFIQIGNIYLFPAIITGAEPTINKEVDQLGYNISAKVRLDIETLYTPTTNLIDQWGI